MVVVEVILWCAKQRPPSKHLPWDDKCNEYGAPSADSEQFSPNIVVIILVSLPHCVYTICAGSHFYEKIILTNTTKWRCNQRQIYVRIRRERMFSHTMRCKWNTQSVPMFIHNKHICEILITNDWSYLSLRRQAEKLYMF